MSELLRAIAAEPYEHRGILHSEVALMIHAVRRLGVRRVIESGRARAQSTFMLGKYLPDVEIHSVELRDSEDQAFGRARVAHLPNVTLHEGDGAILLPMLCAQSDAITAVLCDGPKGAAAVEVVRRCFDLPHVVVGFIHDMRRLDHGQPSPHRAAAVAAFAYRKFSDESAVVAGSSWMDANVLKAGGPCGPRHEAQFGSYGPTLGLFFNPQNQNQKGT